MCNERRLIHAMIPMAFILLVSAPCAFADPISIPRSAFSGGEQVVGFNVSTEQLLPYTENGVTFAFTPFGFVTPFFQALNLQLPGTIGAGMLTVTFSEPVTRAGFDFLNDFGSPTMRAELFSDAGGLHSLGGLDFGTFAPHETAFIGFADNSAFVRADFSFTAPPAASFYIDDFRFDGNTAPIPEPGTVSLTVLGIGLLGSRIRRRLRHE